MLAKINNVGCLWNSFPADDNRYRLWRASSRPDQACAERGPFLSLKLHTRHFNIALPCGLKDIPWTLNALKVLKPDEDCLTICRTSTSCDYLGLAQISYDEIPAGQESRTTYRNLCTVSCLNLAKSVNIRAELAWHQATAFRPTRTGHDNCWWLPC